MSVASYTLLSLPGPKPLFTVKEDATLFGKGGMTSKEIAIQRVAAELGVAPAIRRVLENGVVLMDRIVGSSVADFYGVGGHMPATVWVQIRHILQRLWNHGIEYVDVTPYNFMLEYANSRIWIIDFEHARQVRMDRHLRDVLEGSEEWNKKFA